MNIKYNLNKYVKNKKIHILSNLPILVKILLTMSIVILFVFLLSYISFRYYKNDKEKQTLSVIRQMNTQALSKIDDHLQALTNLSKIMILGDQNTQDILARLENSNHTGTLDFDLQTGLREKFDNIFLLEKDIHSVFVFNLKGRNNYKIKGSAALTHEYNPVHEEWFEKTIDDFGKPEVLRTFKLPYIVNVKNGFKYVFSVARGIVKISSSKVVGVILLNSGIDFLSDLSNQMKIDNGQRIIICDKNGYTIYDTLESNITKKIDKNYIKLTNNAQGLYQNININNVHYLVCYNTSALTGWKLINVIPVNMLNKGINALKATINIITFILVLIAFSAAFIISKRITSPLKKLVALMKIVSTGDFNVKISFESGDEVGQLAKSFNSMIRQVESLINEIYVSEIKQKQMELQMLQEQINPHFIYNTLESIHMMAEINHDKETSKMARAFGKLMRYSMSNIDNIVTVKQELDNLKEYIFLQSVRFEDIYKIEINVDILMMDNLMIKMILQPLVENAIYHGLASKEVDGKITIYCYYQEDKIIFEVIDNGNGIEENALNQINEIINNLEYTSKCVALRNVNKRVKLKYGNQYGLEIKSEINLGTRAIVVLPNIKAELQ
jgi:two-component system, sensor histidine kinase YesM